MRDTYRECQCWGCPRCGQLQPVAVEVDPEFDPAIPPAPEWSGPWAGNSACAADSISHRSTAGTPSAKPVLSTGSTVNPHTYVGQQRYYRMPEPDLYHLGTRGYIPARGQFTAVSPRFEGLGPYAYAGNYPSLLSAPLGLPASITELPGFKDRIEDLIKWLDNNPRVGNQCDRARVTMIRLLMYMIVEGAEKLGSRISSGLLRGWLEGTGTPSSLTYDDLMSDTSFAREHNKMEQHIKALACSGATESHQTAAGMFDKLLSADLYHGFHLWDSFKADVSFSPNGICFGIGGPGYSVAIMGEFTFEDTYNWTKGDATKLPFIDGNFPQDWALELLACSSSVLPGISGHPADFTTTLKRLMLTQVCCPCSKHK